MPNPIRRIVQLVFDRAAGQRTENEAKRNLSGIERGMNRVKTAAIRLAAAIGAAFVARKIAQWGLAAVRAGIGAEETFSKFNTTFGESAESVDAFLADWIRLAGVTNAEGQNMAATLGAIGQGFGLAQEESAEFSARMIQLAGDLTSFHDVPIEETFNALRSGLTETEPLKRFGIVISQNEINLRALAEAGKTNVDQLTRAEIVQSRLNLIYERAGVAVGDLERTQDSTANTLRRLTGGWTRLQEAVGIAIVRNNDASGIIGSLIRLVENLTEWVNRNGDAFGFLGATMDKTITVVGWLLRIIGRLGTGIAASVTFAFIPFIEAAGLATQAVGLLGRGASWLAEKMGADGLAESIDAATDSILAQAQALKDLARSEFEVGKILVRRLTEGRPDRESGPSGGPDRIALPDRGSSGGGGTGADPNELKEANDALREAEQLTRALRTANEVYDDTVANLDAHLRAGRITQETYNRGVAAAQEILDSAGGSVDSVTEALRRHETTLAAIATLSGALGSDFDALDEEASSIEATLRTLAEEGVSATDESFAGLSERLREVQEMMRLTGDEAMEVGKVAMIAGDLVGAAFGGGIGRLAEGKSRQNAILAAEHLAQGFAALLNPFTAPTAAGHFAAAGKFAVIATAWKGLASFSGGGGGGGGGGGAGSGGSPGVRGDVGGGRSERFDPTAPEVHVHFEGAGFSAVNPTVQRVVAGAMQMVGERFGPNARIRVHRTEGG